MTTTHKGLIFALATVVICMIFGTAKLVTILITLYILLSLTTYYIERKRKLTLWQERILIYLFVLPALYLVMPWDELIYLFIGSMVASGLIFFIAKDKE